jgi:hypothetical protein
MEIKTIARETDKTGKGFTLQKLRASSLILDHMQDDQPTDFVTAVEYGGDIFIDGQPHQYIEEDKNYDSKEFSFASGEVKNTLVYFLDYWLNNSKNSRIRFGFYATNGIAKEVLAGRAKELHITLPDGPILDLLRDKDFSDGNLLPAVKSFLLDEYKNQYENNKNVSLAGSHYSAIEAFDEDTWLTFLRAIDWQFNQDSIQELEEKVLAQIRGISLWGPLRIGMERYIRAELFYELDLRHAKQTTDGRFLRKEDVELMFTRIQSNRINEDSLKYLSIDYTDLRNKTGRQLDDFIQKKYYVITGRETAPTLFQRRITLFDPAVRSRGRQTETTVDREKQVLVNFGDQVPFDRPVFLFGELGSGKSTMIADYVRNTISKEPGTVPIFIPSSYLKGKPLRTMQDLTDRINAFVNEEMSFPDALFRLSHAFKVPKEILLVVDGVDELSRQEAQDLLAGLKALKDHHSTLRVIGSGRPLELDGILPSRWLSYAILPLNEQDIGSIFTQEAIADGRSQTDAAQLVAEKIGLLKGRPELMAITTTPLVACSIYQDLDATIGNKTLGDIVRGILNRRLDWHILDNKKHEYEDFLQSFPSIILRQRLLSIIAAEMYREKSRSLHETKILALLESQIADGPDKNKIVNQALLFFKHAFLQETTDNRGSFISQPLLECSAGLHFADELAKGARSGTGHAFPDIAADWRPLSFGMATIRERGDVDAIRPGFEAAIRCQLTWPNTNIAQAAVVLAELRDKELAVLFFDIIGKLSWRPLRFMGEEEKLSPLSIAACMTLAGDRGFDWFWEEYLDGRRPLNDFEERLVADILGFYIISWNFRLPSSRVQRLNSQVVWNRHLGTSFCHHGFRVLALLPEISFDHRERTLLLGDLLNDDAFGMAAEAALRRLQETGTMSGEILNALETVCRRSEFAESLTPSLLWLEFHDGRPLSSAVLMNCLSASTKENHTLIFDRLTRIVPAENLLPYLRFLVLSEKPKFAGNAALFLLWQGETDGGLLNPELSQAIDWLSTRYDAVEDISVFFRSQSSDQAIILADYIPIGNHLGVQPSFWRLFLEAVARSKQLFLRDFAQMLTNMSLHTLTRYPDVRLALVGLLKNRLEYKELLLELSDGLSAAEANNASAILVVCFPEDESEALVRLTKGTFGHHSEKEEWNRFLMGLNFSLKVKEDLHSRLAEFVLAAKTFALSLLYFQDFLLTTAELEELVDGLLGEGHHFDRSLLPGSTETSALADETVFNKLLVKLDGPDKEIAGRSADALLSYHRKRLSLKQLAQVYMIRIERYQSAFYHLQVDEKNLLETADFRSEVMANAGLNPTLLSLFYAADGSGSGWEAFFSKALNSGRHFHTRDLQEVYIWLMSFLRLKGDQRQFLAEAAKTMADIPAYEEDPRIYSWILLIADELGLSVSETIRVNIDQWFTDMDKEVDIALSLRASLPLASIPAGPEQSYSIIFSRYQRDGIVQIPRAELSKLLADTQSVSVQITQGIGEVLLYGQLSKEERDSLEGKSTAGAVLSVVIGYCRNEEFSVEELLKIIEEDFFRTRPGHDTPIYAVMQQKIASIAARNEGSRDEYIRALRRLLGTDSPFLFRPFLLRLFRAGEQPSLAEIKKLLDFMLTWDGIIDLNLAYHLSNYFANAVPVEEKGQLVGEIERTLGAISNNYGQRTLNGYMLSCWLLSLAAIHLSKSVSQNAERGFLMGLQYVFIDRNDFHFRYRLQAEGVVFPAKDLLNITWELFEKIDPETIKALIEAGLKSNVREIKATCRILRALAVDPLRKH